MDNTPSRSVALELKEDRRAMHEGYVFLDEKCLLLAAEMLRQLAQYTAAQSAFLAAWDAAMAALQAAVARNGLEGLQSYPPLDPGGTVAPHASRSLMGVRLQDAVYAAGASPAATSVDRSPEAEACRSAFGYLLARAAPLAALSGNLERLQQEYRRAVRRARALQDVLLPELDRSVHDIEARLEEQEQEETVWMRQNR